MARRKVNKEQTEQEKPKRGRPQIQIDKDTFERLCGLQCTQKEIASFFRCSEDTIDRWCKRTYEAKFEEIRPSFSEAGKVSLRRTQFRMAETSPQMAIWLGKQYLGQKEKKDYDFKGALPVVISGGESLED